MKSNIFCCFEGLFSPLLRLIATHFPQLCLVEDWIYEANDSQFSSMSTTDSTYGSSMSFSSQAIERGNLSFPLYFINLSITFLNSNFLNSKNT